MDALTDVFGGNENADTPKTLSRDQHRRDIKSFHEDNNVRRFVFSDQIVGNSYKDEGVSLKGVLQFTTPSLAAIKAEALRREDVRERRQTQIKKETRTSVLYNEAVRYGAQVALRNTLSDFSAHVATQSSNLERVYPFRNFMLHKNTMLPPIINLKKSGISITDNTFSKFEFKYVITQQAKFTDRIPNFRDYLTFQKYGVRDPSIFNIPVSLNELTHWMNGIADGWVRGEQQATIEINNGITKLNLDLLGMTRYHMLLKKKMVSSPAISKSTLGLQGDQRDIEVGVVNFVMDGAPVFELDMSNWEPLPMIDELELKQFIERKSRSFK